MKNTIVYINIRSDMVERVTPFYKAREMDLRVLLLIDHGKNVPADLADETIRINTYDFTEVKKYLESYSQSYNIVGITTWGDKDVELVAFLCSEFHLPGNTPEVAKRCRNKYLMRETLSNLHPQLCPEYYSIENLDELKKHYSDSTKSVLKPVGASGSKAIMLLDHEKDIEDIWRKLRQLTQSDGKNIFTYFPDQYILENFIEGQEFSFDGLVQNKTIYSAAVTYKDVTPDYSIEYNALTNGDFTDDRNQLIRAASLKALDALGINNSGFHLEGRINGKVIKILEVAARPGGGYIASHLIQNATGIDYTSNIIRLAIGQDMESLMWKSRLINMA